ncbi:MAG: hypothetical protein OEY14_09330 [Myxococcales bacterium]|nr:hypothetical protein [Myxococcales bacterium]
MKMRTMATLTLTGILSCGALGCGGDGGTPSVSASNFDEAAVRELCTFIHTCSIPDGDLLFVRVVSRTVEGCVELAQAEIGSTGIAEAVADGSVLYDGAAAGACLSAIGDSCTAGAAGIFGDRPSCEGALTGTLPEGDPCYISEQCAGDAYCDNGFGGSCPGTCTPRIGLGAACFRDAECSRAAGASECAWNEALGEDRCVSTVLHADAAMGEPCGTVVTETSREYTMCSPGSWCGTDDLCQAPLAAGASCGSIDEICVEGHICADGSCMAFSLGSEGDACDDRFAVCDPGQRLDCIDGSCAVITDGMAGSPCRGGDFAGFDCNAGLVCLRASDTCGEPLATGAVCDSDRECASGYCDRSGVDSVCGARGCGG